MSKEKNSELTVPRKGRGPHSNLKPFEKGKSGNPAGRPVGARDRRTVIRDALMRIGEKKNMLPEEIEEAIQVAGIEKALKGSFLHYAEISNGLYGKITDKTEVDFKGKTLADLITAATVAKKKAPPKKENATRSKSK